MSTFFLRSKFALGRDLAVFNDAEYTNQTYYIDGKWGFRTKADIKDGDGHITLYARGKILGIPRHLQLVSSSGKELAYLRAKYFSPLRSRMTLTFADGKQWQLSGNLIEKEYSITCGEERIAQITQKWLTFKDKYAVEIADRVDPSLVFAVVWAVDVWRER